MAVRKQLLGSLVGGKSLLEFRRDRPVQEVQVEVIKAKLANAGVEGAERLVVAEIGDAQLRGDEKILARDSAAEDALTDLCLVVVAGCRVDQPVSGHEGSAHCLGGLGGGDCECTEPQCRHANAVVEFDARHMAMLIFSIVRIDGLSVRQPRAYRGSSPFAFSAAIP